MIVVGIDPGGRDTGIAVVDCSLGGTSTPPLLASLTVHRSDKGRLEQPPRGYLLDVVGAVLIAVREHGAGMVAVEAVKKPNPHVKRKNGNSIIDPAAIMGTAVVFGAIFGRSWTIPVVAVQPGGNGTYLPLNRYPAPLGTTGMGNDKRRHERSAYDVAATAPTTLRFTDAGGYGP
jgi:hypothetical protein